jgi:predicted ester cyclase
VVSIEANKAIARRFIEVVWNAGDLAVAEDLLAPALINHDPDGRTTDRAGFLAFIRQTRAAMPDIRFTIDDMIAENDGVATRVTITAKPTGAAAAAAPAGQPVTWTGIGIIRVGDGKIVEQWANTDSTVAAPLGMPQPQSE